MTLPKRHGSTDTYRYGFNGKEKDDDVKGEGLHYNYGFRVYDPRLGKFLSQDPLFKGFPHYSPYQFAGNSPIMNIDLDGLEELPVTASRLVVTNTVIDRDGKRLPDGTTLKVRLTGSGENVYKVNVGKNVISEGYEGGSYGHISRVYRRMVSPRINGAYKYKFSQEVDTVIRATIGPPPKLDIEDKPIIKVVTDPKPDDKIPSKLPEISDDSTINESQKVEVNESILKAVGFNMNKATFLNYDKTRKEIDPLLDKIKENPKNSIELTINIQVSGENTIIKKGELNWDLSRDKDYKASDLANDRVKRLWKYIDDYKVNREQVKINATYDISSFPQVKAKTTIEN